jgi:hypothetical protein
MTSSCIGRNPSWSAGDYGRFVSPMFQVRACGRRCLCPQIRWPLRDSCAPGSRRPEPGPGRHPTLFDRHRHQRRTFVRRPETNVTGRILGGTSYLLARPEPEYASISKRGDRQCAFLLFVGWSFRSFVFAGQENQSFRASRGLLHQGTQIGGLFGGIGDDAETLISRCSVQPEVFPR